MGKTVTVGRRFARGGWVGAGVFAGTRVGAAGVVGVPVDTCCSGAGIGAGASGGMMDAEFLVGKARTTTLGLGEGVRVSRGVEIGERAGVEMGRGTKPGFVKADAWGARAGEP